jgi:hypothetical protein
MEFVPPKAQFWAKLTFEDKATEEYLRGEEDLSKAPWRPGFFYPDIIKQGYFIFPVARDGDEFGFFAMNQEFWNNLHRHKIKPGLEFSLGPVRDRLCARGIVTRLAE